MRTLSIFLTVFLFGLEALAQCPPSLAIGYSTTYTGGCDSTLVTITNTSQIDLSTLSYFEWDMGDGEVILGDSITNTIWWNGVNNDKKLKHTYRQHGSFLIKLIAETDAGCRDTFIYHDPITNIALNSKIEAENRGGGEFVFNLDNDVPMGFYNFQWNFGDPASANKNYYFQVKDAPHHYGVGPHMISFFTSAGPCQFRLFDTIQVLGPVALIEAPYNRIAHGEKYQCGTNDSVHFTNASSYYHNDSNPSDEDSVLIVNGESVLAFNYNVTTRQGDQTALASAAHLANRTMGAQVMRIWDFGDEYAPACTTSTAKNQNIGVNCNFSEDEFPVHLYRNWDSVYYNDYYLTNTTLCQNIYNEATNSCSIQNIDTSNLTLHRKLFEKLIPHNYNATLYLKDTVTGIESVDHVTIVNTRPDASKLELVSGIQCPYDGTQSNYLEFDMNTGGQSWFAVNFDSFVDPNNFIPSTSGGIFPPPAPPSIPVYGLPYELAGSYPDEFIKVYTHGELGNIGTRNPEGSITVGLIVGNGPLGTNNTAPTCVDTVWYHDFIRIPVLDANFNIVTPGGKNEYMCKGDEAVVEIAEPLQQKISTLRWIWGNQLESNLDLYTEKFHYFEDYPGPSPTRNDANVTYNGQPWKYNYIVRQEVFSGVVSTIDTIVVSILKNWKTEVERKGLVFDLWGSQTCYNTIEFKDIAKVMGDGTFGCLDTTGFGSSIKFNYSEYKRYNGDDVVIHGNTRYAYTNAAHTDSIEVAMILHFRDSSLQGYDTLVVGNDTTFGVWKHQYRKQEIIHGDTVISFAAGPMVPSFYLANTTGCSQRSLKYLNVGHRPEFKLQDTLFCLNEQVVVDENNQYWQLGEENPFTYPYDTNHYWVEPMRYLGGLEWFEIDWDANDGAWDGIRDITPSHTYTSNGQYTISMATKDSAGCLDTFRLDVMIGGLSTGFSHADISTGCAYKVQFHDSSQHLSQSMITSWEWEFGDGSATSSDQHPQHEYANHGSYDVTLVVANASGCSGTITRTITIAPVAGALPPHFSYSVNDLKLTATNLHNGDHSLYVWYWGDGTTDTATNGQHTYNMASQRTVCLRNIDTFSGCISDTCYTINIGGCNAKYGYSKDTSTQFGVVLHDSSIGSNLSYVWYWGDGDSSTTATPTHTYSNFGKYDVILKVSNTNCISFYSDSIGMDSLGNLYKTEGFIIRVLNGIGDVDDLSFNVLIYPNPIEESFRMKVPVGRVIRSCRLLDIKGKEHVLEPVMIGKEIYRVSGVDVAPGTYTLLLQFDQGVGRSLLIVR